MSIAITLCVEILIFIRDRQFWLNWKVISKSRTKPICVLKKSLYWENRQYSHFIAGNIDRLNIIGISGLTFGFNVLLVRLYYTTEAERLTKRSPFDPTLAKIVVPADFPFPHVSNFNSISIYYSHHVKNIKIAF